MKKPSSKGIWIFLAVAFVIYFVTAFYYNYKAENTDFSANLPENERAMCSLTELSDGRLRLVIPPTYVYGASQEDLDKAAEANGYESITLGADGSATYILTGEKHDEMLKNLSAGIDEKIAGIPGNGSYNDITSITPLDDAYTDFKVVVNADKIDDKVSMAAINLKLLSTMYNAFNGVGDAPFHVTYYGKDGSVIAETS